MPDTMIVTTLENKPGTLATLGEILGRANVNIREIGSVNFGSDSRVVFVADDPSKAKKALRDEGFEFQEITGVAVKAGDKPGELGRIARRIADAGINIEGVLGFSGTSLVIAASDVAKLTNAVGAENVISR